MKLHDLCEIFESLPFPILGEKAHPEKATVKTAVTRIAEAVVNDEFLADCIAWELRLLESDRLRNGLVPFFTLPGRGLRFAFGYWPPGATASPHEHTAWTITAVCRNELDVLTYDRGKSYRRRELVPKNNFHAISGKAGFIYDPCIHEPKNLTRDWSLSFHVMSPRDGEQLDDQYPPLPGLCFPSHVPAAADKHPFSQVIVSRQRGARVRQLARILAQMDVPQAHDLSKTCFNMSSSGTRRLIARMSRRSIEEDRAKSRLRLVRTHKDLVLCSRFENGAACLDVETPSGPVEQLTVNDLAREAIDFVAREIHFDIDALPGSLSTEERMAIGEALEETGLFKAVRE
jgi:hypothetical protein